MTLIQKLNEDLSREYSHWHFYMQAATLVGGLHREEMKEFFMEEAAGEMAHIREFSDIIMALGETPTTEVAPYMIYKGTTSPESLLQEALEMEDQVVNNYIERMHDADLETDRRLGIYVHVFLEDQLMDSHKAVNEIKLMLNR